jgi:DNA modification methylase
MLLETIKKNPKNPRLIKDAQFERLKKSVQEFPQMMTLRPIVVDSEGIVLGGNMRLEALKSLGYKEVPDEWVKRADELTEEQKREFVIKDNGAFGEYNWDLLANEWSDLPLADWGVDLPEDWLAGGKEEDEAEVAQLIDRAAELQEKWQVKRGDLFSIGRHRLLCGDSTAAGDVERLMGGAKAQAVLTDPIYGQGQKGVPDDEPEKHKPTIDTAVKVLPLTDGIIVAFQSTRTFPVWLDAVREAGYKFERMLWLYKAAQCTFPWRGWILKSESIVVSTKGQAQWQDVHPYSHDCYYLPEVSGELDASVGWHGSVKPLKVISDLIRRICPEEAVVFDGFVGSGTTIVAAEETNRACFAMDKDPSCCAVTLERMSNLGLEPKLLENE